MQPKYDKLRDARVLLLGGTSGIGFAVAEASIEAGAFVIISGSNPERLSSALSKLTTSYPEAAAENRISGHVCDLSDVESLEKNIKQLLDFATDGQTHKLDHITYTAANIPQIPDINNYKPSPTKETTSILRHEAPLTLASLCPPYMNPGRRRSSITLTSASTATKPTPGRAILSALGASTEGLTRGLAVDLAPAIRVNAVAPGVTDTELLRGIMGPDEEGRKRFREILKGGTLVGEIGDPGDVAEAYVYCMRDGNLTGAVIHTDGGRLLK